MATSVNLLESKLIGQITFNDKIWFGMSENYLRIFIDTEEEAITHATIKMLLEPVLKDYILERKEFGFLIDPTISFDFVKDETGNNIWSFYKHSSIIKPVSKFKVFLIKLIIK